MRLFLAAVVAALSLCGVAVAGRGDSLCGSGSCGGGGPPYACTIYTAWAWWPGQYGPTPIYQCRPVGGVWQWVRVA